MRFDELPEPIRCHLEEHGDCWVLKACHRADTPRPVIGGKRMSLGKWIRALAGQPIAHGRRLESFCGEPRCYRHLNYSDKSNYGAARYRRMERAVFTNEFELRDAVQALLARGYRRASPQQCVLPNLHFRVGRGKGGNRLKKPRWILYWQPPRRALVREGNGRIRVPETRRTA